MNKKKKKHYTKTKRNKSVNEILWKMEIFGQTTNKRKEKLDKITNEKDRKFSAKKKNLFFHKREMKSFLTNKDLWQIVCIGLEQIEINESDGWMVE